MRQVTELRGRSGGVSAAHPLAVSAGQEILRSGGTAADAAIAAQAALCVLMPDACGLGGDMLALVHVPGKAAWALNGTGAAPGSLVKVSDDGADSITVPGIVDAWCVMSREHGRLPLSRVLEPAIRLASAGVRISGVLGGALSRHRARLQRGGAEGWCLFDRSEGELVEQPQLAVTLKAIAAGGKDAFYAGESGRAIAGAVQRLGGALAESDLSSHRSVAGTPIETRWGELRIMTQPPMSQGILLNMAVNAISRLGDFSAELDDHIAIEATEAAFAFRDEVGSGVALLERPLSINLKEASRRGGPRAYLHTAGVAAADGEGRIVSSLVSVFDDFGSCLFVPELGITLNNRAGGFTSGANEAAGGKRPVHTLAPILIETLDGVLGLATPGADGQVQTLLQIVMGVQHQGLGLARAVARPRWRSEGGKLLIERSHPGVDTLAGLGHQVSPLPDGEVRFGAVVCAGSVEGDAVVVADWRRETAAGVA
jgi:gamma-glutamyltranspeptidase/glutathione hydrolase